MPEGPGVGGVSGVSGAWAGADERGEERLRPGSEWILFVEKYGPRALWGGAWQGWGRCGAGASKRGSLKKIAVDQHGHGDTGVIHESQGGADVCLCGSRQR